jgi:hypothetical protein
VAKNEQGTKKSTIMIMTIHLPAKKTIMMDMSMLKFQAARICKGKPDEIIA